ncbi:MAG: hypothetical protein ACD_57C00319G0003 [uncultured bacterium]|uniref:Excinuclease ABC subunit C n=1 Tax=Candidatus Curtissbacteria bacterium RIFOXYA1_FULL_41_14 TaxID=1797737 RepID=A0A1F5HBD4_9BACT|nr:MAG: hypothetical protein ACD_57C00319G0003 [uncultured bacterium]KKR58274.1 MAG: Excinuclease ABC subunit C [Candidatus Curtissbacteria bacterium GW2011_GWB1_40_28]KKR61829.1 MAG: Excinuclease ABC subunit C [Microgenomates group bacterium GW2011_GWC1_40_35]KKS01616.1 MAG: Excinuclease ABC subunit C [Candidatus Curtissbacteria bacterium GW2011_GWC2_41_21]OGD92793.1 MAG: hypothetical protein A3E14_00175 [Candidatus Curtissbacteria bacterium RIFCSPHIGHO2_12_FULL_41_13]OGE01484.1 MAG: hypothet
MTNLKKKLTNLPDSPGVYRFYDEKKNIIYVGKSLSIRKRVSTYFQTRILGPKTRLMVSKIANLDFIKVFSEFEALLLEAKLIKVNQPFFNTVAKDDKSPLYIKITQDKVPLITVTRREKPRRGVFLKGPFPSAKTTREVLKIIRKIFPYCHHKNPRKPCLYVHLGLCPYPYQSQQSLVLYLDNVKKIKKLLMGKSQILIRDLTREMARLSSIQKYEQAQEVKEQIRKIEAIVTSYHSPSEFLEHPGLVDDLSISRLNELKEILNLKKKLGRIECYDISNIGGNLATGSMAVFTSGQPDKDQYRKFRIKFTHTPDDYQMIGEILTRRFHNDWPVPDLVIIDGGRGQLNTALTVINKLKLKVVPIAIAKRFEYIFHPDKPSPISLPKDNPARQLVAQIRDEAHRFALSYHRLLRSKAMLTEKI